MTNCKDRVQALVECARRGAELDAALQDHLAVCGSCSARWEAERALSGEFRAMRTQAMVSDRESQARRDARAAALMVEFSRRKEPVMMPARAMSLRSSAGWMLSAAAALLLAIGIGYGVGMRTRQQAVEPAPSGVVYETIADGNFVALPYALPSVPGELVSIVHADLAPEELAGMGFDVDPALLADGSGSIQADVVVGEDGFPQAVRITPADDVTNF
jgi:hypothetical protein